MVFYECYNCGYNSTDIYNIKRHLNRKKICKSIHNDINLNDCKAYILTGLSYNDYITQCKSNETLSSKTESFNKTNNNEVINNRKYHCISCDNVYKYRQSLYRHKKTCTKRIQIEQNDTMKTIKEQYPDAYLETNEGQLSIDSIIDNIELETNMCSLLELWVSACSFVFVDYS